jgi:hypothetical protein
LAGPPRSTATPFGVTRLLVILPACAFVSVGLPDGLLGVAWRSMRLSFDRDLDTFDRDLDTFGGVLLVTATWGTSPQASLAAVCFATQTSASPSRSAAH